MSIIFTILGLLINVFIIGFILFVLGYGIFLLFNKLDKCIYSSVPGYKIYKLVNVLKVTYNNRLINKNEYLLVCKDMKYNKEIVVNINVFNYNKIKNTNIDKVTLSCENNKYKFYNI